jgi:hypothetical protein
MLFYTQIGPAILRRYISWSLRHGLHNVKMKYLWVTRMAHHLQAIWFPQNVGCALRSRYTLKDYHWNNSSTEFFVFWLFQE